MNSLNIFLFSYICFFVIGCVVPDDPSVSFEELPVVKFETPVEGSTGASKVRSQVHTSTPRNHDQRNSRLSDTSLPTVIPIPTIEVPTVVLAPTIEVPTVTPTVETHSLVTVMIGSVRFEAEVADTPDERSKGLSGRDRLSIGAGMLFLFEDMQVSTFWMGGMLFPLDFIWISRDCKVVDITPSAPILPAGITASQVPVYLSSEPASFVFEINAGEAHRRNITIGDAVWFSGLDDIVASNCQSRP